MSGTTLTPEVLWAQRSSSSEAEKNYIHLTIMAPDVQKEEMKLDLQPTKLSFNGVSTSKKCTYAVDLEFFAEIDPKESKIHHTSRAVEMVLRKKELKEEYWPRLLKDGKKMHFLKTNFDKWVDEDEQDEAPEDDAMMNQMNPMAGAGGGMPGMGGMGGMGGDGGFGGIDFSKLGGGAGGMPDFSSMGGMGGMNMGDMGGDEGDDSGDDDDMPELETDEGKPAGDAKPAEAEAAKPKIEEVA